MSGRCMSFAILLAGVSLSAGIAAAQPEPWAHPDGSIHYYDAISTPAGINWNFAWDSALGHGGYLATITSQSENDFIFSLVDTDLYWYQRPGTDKLAGPWIGGTQDFGAQEPDSGWHWVTAETMNYLNWTPGQPDNQGGSENALHFGESVGVRVPTWDDANGTDDSIRGFVRELSADSTTIGLFQNDTNAFVGYSLFAPLMSNYTYLVDNKGRLVHSWRSSYRPSMSAYLLEDGKLLRTAYVGNTVFDYGGGRVEEFDWDGNLVWAYDYSTDLHCQHHDIEPLPNGNVLMIASEFKTRAEAIAAGRNPGLLMQSSLWPDYVIEVDPATDSIVWEWHIWDHLIQDFDSTKANHGVVADHPELVDINFIPPDRPFGPADWNHTNSVDYNEQFDQIILSVRELCEVLIIDHSTTTEEARGHSGGRQGVGGDILYRWGNPRVYRAGDSTDQKFFRQHDARWIEPGLPGAGHIMVFNNGQGRPGGNYSSVDEFIPACDSTGHYLRPSPGAPFGPDAQSWVYHADPPPSFYSGVMSGAHRLPNGNTLICSADDYTLREVTHDTAVVWRYVNPVAENGPLYQGDPASAGMLSLVFRATRYQPDYPGLAGRDLTPGYPIERYRTPSSGISEPGTTRVDAAGLHVRPNPFGRQTTICFGVSHAALAELGIYSVDGRLIRTLPTTDSQVVWNGTDDFGRPVGRGVYWCRLRGPGSIFSKKLVKVD